LGVFFNLRRWQWPNFLGQKAGVQGLGVSRGITEQRPATFFNDVFASPVVFFCGLPGPRQDRVHDPQVIHHPDSPLGGSHGFL
jgi:hypothetical protein